MLPPEQILRVWERGLRQDSVDRALTLLSAAYPQQSRDDLAALSIGQRDVRLLAIHENLFGPVLRSYAECPHCGAQLEFTIDASDLRPQESAPCREVLDVTAGDIQVRCRPPNSHDLAAVSQLGEIAAARVLAECCVVEASRCGVPIPASALPASAIEEMAAAIGDADAQADTVLALQCADCRHGWKLSVDIVSFLWIEVNTLAKVLLQQVHLLAWAYGWRESDILALSDARRRGYLEMVG